MATPVEERGVGQTPTPLTITVRYLLYTGRISIIESYIKTMGQAQNGTGTQRVWWLRVYLFTVYSFIKALVMSTVYF